MGELARPGPIAARDRPVFVIGFQRSGTTLLQSLLGSHPAIAAAPEIHFWLRIRVLEQHWGDLREDANLARVVHALLHPPVPLYEHTGLTEQAVLARAAAGPRTYAGVLAAMLDEFAHLHGKRRWSEKSPGQLASQALALFPDAFVVHIVRDPRDVIGSSLAMPWTTKDTRRLARSWRELHRDAVTASDEVGPDRYILVRYEDLTAEPVTAMSKVIEWLGEDFDPYLIEDLAGRRPTVARAAAPWQQQALEPIHQARRRGNELSTRQLAQVEAICHAELSSLGYSRPPRWRIVLGHVVNVVMLPRSVPSWWWALRARRARRRPDLAAGLVQEFLEQQAQAVARQRPPS